MAYPRHHQPARGPASHYQAITPNDSTEYDPPIESLVIGTAGALVVTRTDGTDVTFGNAPAGLLPIRCKKVKATGTAASNIVGLF